MSSKKTAAAAKGHGAQHAKKTVAKPAKKKATTAKHPAAKAKGHTAHKTKAKTTTKRALALGDELACCAAEAVAASLRELGIYVGDEAVLELFQASRGDPDQGVMIADVLQTASQRGLLGWRPSRWTWINPAEELTDTVILGLDLPGSHAVLATPKGWWSWGELYRPGEFPHAVIEEAWAVSWSLAKRCTPTEPARRLRGTKATHCAQPPGRSSPEPQAGRGKTCTLLSS